MGFLSGFCLDFVWLGFVFLCSICGFFKFTFYCLCLSQNACDSNQEKEQCLSATHFFGSSRLWRALEISEGAIDAVSKSVVAAECQQWSSWFYFAAVWLHTGDY